MPPDADKQTYFDTPARAERLQLLLHLVRNAGEVIYLRAPAGAGKTTFAHQLLAILGDETACVWIRAGLDADVVATTASQLGLDGDELGHWPDAVFEQTGDQDLLFVVDDADLLDLPAVERLAAMHARGGRLLLLGHGGLAQTTREWDVQFVDLPPFDGAQSAVFLRSSAGDQATLISDDLAAALHRTAHGLPGPLLDGLGEVLSRTRGQARPAAPGGRRRAGWRWLAGGAVVLLLSAVLIFQEQINALLEPAEAPTPQLGESEPPRLLPLPEPARIERTPGQAPDAVDTLLVEREESGPPPIVLPELSQVPSPAADGQEPAGTGEGPAPDLPETPPAPDESPVIADQDQQERPDMPAAKGGADEADALEAVMRDALSAAGSGQATPSGQVTPGVDTTPPSAGQAPEADAEVTQPVTLGRLAPAGRTPASTPVAVPDPAPSAAQVAPAPVVESGTPVQPPREPPPVAAVVEVPPRSVPVEERIAPAPPKVGTPPPTTKPAPPAPAVEVATRAPAGGGIGWLKSRRPGHYTLQLVGARDRAAVERFVRTHKIAQPYAIFERQLNGGPWYSLVAGDYPDRDAAVAARDRLPRGLKRSDVWPRTFDSIHKTL